MLGIGNFIKILIKSTWSSTLINRVWCPWMWFMFHFFTLSQNIFIWTIYIFNAFAFLLPLLDCTRYVLVWLIIKILWRRLYILVYICFKLILAKQIIWFIWTGNFNACIFIPTFLFLLHLKHLIELIFKHLVFHF